MADAVIPGPLPHAGLTPVHLAVLEDKAQDAGILKHLLFGFSEHGAKTPAWRFGRVRYNWLTRKYAFAGGNARARAGGGGGHGRTALHLAALAGDARAEALMLLLMAMRMNASNGRGDRQQLMADAALSMASAASGAGGGRGKAGKAKGHGGGLKREDDAAAAATAANVNVVDDQQYTPLHFACRNLAHRSIGILLDTPGIETQPVNVSRSTFTH